MSMDAVDYIMAWESGELSNWETIKMFAEMIKSGICWSLQGCYGRMAHDLIEAGYVNTKGDILIDEDDLE